MTKCEFHYFARYCSVLVLLSKLAVIYCSSFHLRQTCFTLSANTKIHLTELTVNFLLSVAQSASAKEVWVHSSRENPNLHITYVRKLKKYKRNELLGP